MPGIVAGSDFGTRWARRSAFVEVLLLILLAPLALFPTPGRFAALLAIPGFWVARWLVLRRLSRASNPSNSLPVSRSLAQAQPLPRTPLNIAILLLMSMVLVSLYATYDIAVSMPKVAGMIYGFGVYYAVVRACREPRAWWLGLGAFLIAGVGLAGLGLLGSRWSEKFPFLESILERLPMRISGLPGAEAGFNPNEVAGALTWVIPIFLSLAVYWAWQFGEFEHWVGRPRAGAMGLALGLGTALTLGAFVLSQSRSAIFGLGLAVPIMLAASGRKGRLALLPMLVAGIAMAWVAWARFSSDSALPLTLRLRQFLPLYELDGRIELWSRAIYGIQDFAFTGMGMNTFRTVVHVLYPLFLTGPDTDIGHAHNLFLQAALDLGVPGLLAYLGLWLGAAGMLLSMWRALPQSDSPAGGPTLWRLPRTLIRACLLGLAGSLLAHFLYGLTDAIALGAKPGFLWWWLLGLITSLYVLLSDENEPGKARI